MRVRLLVSSCFLAVVFLAIALRGTWASAKADDGSRFDITLRSVTHVLGGKASGRCVYLTGRGAVEYCAPASEGDASFSMLCSAFPLIVVGLFLALAAGVVNHVAPYTRNTTAAALSAASLAAAFTGTVIAQMSMQRALKVLEEVPVYFGGFAFAAAWIAMGLLLFAAMLSTTSTMLGHT